MKANFLRLLRLVERGIPLPLGNLRSQRSLVDIWNLCQLIATCAAHPAAAGQTILVSAQEDLSTPDVICLIAGAMRRPARLLSFPVGVLRVAARLLGQRDAVEWLVGSLQVDSRKATRLLGWTPEGSVEEVLQRTVAWYRD